MRRLAEKVVIIAQICITLVFALTTLFGLSSNYVPTETLEYNGVLSSLMFVLFLTYIGLSAYMIYINFSERENLKRVLLFCDSESATRTTSKVIRKIINECARHTSGVKVKKIKIRADDKQGFCVTLVVNINGDNVSQIIDTFRCMITDSFKNTLGITFNSINFEVAKLNARFTPNISDAEEQADKLNEQRELTTEIYNEPLENDVNLDCITKTEEERQRDEQR